MVAAGVRSLTAEKLQEIYEEVQAEKSTCIIADNQIK